MITKSIDSLSHRKNLSWILQTLTATASSPAVSEMSPDLTDSAGFSTDPFLVCRFGHVGNSPCNIWKALHRTVQSQRIFPIGEMTTFLSITTQCLSSLKKPRYWPYILHKCGESSWLHSLPGPPGTGTAAVAPNQSPLGGVFRLNLVYSDLFPSRVRLNALISAPVLGLVCLLTWRLKWKFPKLLLFWSFYLLPLCFSVSLLCNKFIIWT